MSLFRPVSRVFVIACLSAFIFLLGGALLPEEGQAGFLDWLISPKKESSPQTAVPSATFTIKAIETGSANSNSIKITFTESCFIDNLRDRLKIFPPVRIDWNNTSFKGTAVELKGRFKFDQDYTVSISDDTVCSGKKYVKSINTFKIPEMESELGFMGDDTVIERDSRQMLHLKMTNVSQVRFQGLKIPPILVPLVLKEIKEHTETVKVPLHNARRHRHEQSQEEVKSYTRMPFETLRDSVTRKYAELAARPEMQQEFGDLMNSPLTDEQIFFPGHVRNKSQEFSLPLGFRKDKEKGAIEAIRITSTGPKEQAETQIRLLRITDLGITYKLSRNSLLLWITSLNSGAPMAGVSVATYIGSADVIPLGKTDEKGLLFIKGSNKRPRFSLSENKKQEPMPLPIKDIRFIVAATSTDKTYIEINEAGNVRPDWVGQSESVNTRTNLSKGRIFTERGIYRPGERVFFKGTVREYRDGVIRPPSGLKPKMNVTNSKNEEIYSKELSLSDFGTINDSLDIKPYFPLGTYTASMKFSDEHTSVRPANPPAESAMDDEGDDYGEPARKRQPQDGTAITTFEVQEFVAPRHFVELGFRRETKKDETYVNLNKEIDLLVCTITGKYYAGGPVKHGKVRWKATYRGTDFRYRDFKNYTFGSVIEEPMDLIESGESLLDEKGTVKVSFPVSREVAAGLFSVEVSATVVDFDGKASSDTAAYQEDPQFKIGLSAHESGIRSGDMQVLKAIVVDRDGKRVQNGELKVDVLREDWIYVKKRNDQGGMYWDEKRALRKDHSSTIIIKNSEALFDFDFGSGGTFVIKVTYKGADNKEYSSSTSYTVEGFSYGYQDRQRSFERLSVSTERKEYSQGETIKVLLYPRKPLASVLMTIERKGILEFRNIGPVTGKKYIDIPVAKIHEPNIYISFSGTVSRKDFPLHSGQFDDKAPDFLLGVVNVEIKREPGDLKVKISDDETELKFEPGADVRLKVSSEDKAGKGVETEMALCVVDESVLALTRFKTPHLDDLSKFISPLSVFTGELRTELLKQTPYGFIRNEPLTGGDGSGGREISLSKLRKDFRPVAFFTPNLKTDKDGHAEISFKLPDTMTNYRVYAVAGDRGSKFASSERGLLAVKDFYLEPGTPRFFTKGDSFSFFVSAFNKTRTEGKARLTLGKDALVKFASGEESFELKALDRTLIPVKGEAVNAGDAALLFSGQFGNKSDNVEIKIPVRSGQVPWNDVLFGTVKDTATVAYIFPDYLSNINIKDLHPNDVKAVLAVSGSPFIRMSRGIRYLLHYPYGCVEQTSSGVLPLAALRNLIRDGLIPDITLAEADKFVRPGIDRLLSMQTSSGGFAYWPGGSQPEKWGTIYAVSALTQSRLAGLDVPADRMALAMDYLAKEVKEGASDKHFMGYAVYLLAMNGRHDAALFRSAYNDIDRMTRDAALMTLLAARVSNSIPEKELMEKTRQVIDRQRDKNISYAFNAYYRDPAVALIAAVTILKDNEVSGRLSAELIGGISREGIWTSTSDTGWSLVALGEYFRNSNFMGGPVKVTLRQDGLPETSVLLEPKDTYHYVLDPGLFLKKPFVSISSESGAGLTYMLNLTFPRTDLARQGYSKGFKIHKTIANTDGSKEIRVGDMVKVTIDIETENRYKYSYVVLDDPLPAGLVAINSAIKTEESLPVAESQGEQNFWDEWEPITSAYKFTPNHFEMRDDRVLAFKDRAWSGHYQYSYYARAVCEGSFMMPSTKVQLMYEPDVAAFTPMGQLSIMERK